MEGEAAAKALLQEKLRGADSAISALKTKMGEMHDKWLSVVKEREDSLTEVKSVLQASSPNRLWET